MIKSRKIILAIMLVALSLCLACSDKSTEPKGPPPALSSIAPAYGFPTIVLNIYGMNFGVSGSIQFGNDSATIVGWSDTLVTAIIPDAEGEVDVKLINSSNLAIVFGYHILTAAEFLDSLLTKNAMEICFNGDNSYYSYYRFEMYPPGTITYDTIPDASPILISASISNHEISWTGNTFSLDYDSTAEILGESDTLSHHMSGSLNEEGTEINFAAANYLLSHWASYYRDRNSMEIDVNHIAITQIGDTIVYSFTGSDLENHIEFLENYAYEYHLMTFYETEYYYLGTDWNSSQIEPRLTIKFYRRE